MGMLIDGKYLSSIASAGPKSKTEEYIKTIAGLAEQSALHFDFSAKPTTLITQRRPHEAKAANEYRINIWQPVTWSIIQKMVQLVRATIFHPQLFKIEYPESTLNAVQESHDIIRASLWTPGIGIEGFAKDILCPWVLSDPNARIVIWISDSEKDREDESDEALSTVSIKIIPSGKISNVGKGFVVEKNGHSKTAFIEGQGVWQSKMDGATVKWEEVSAYCSIYGLRGLINSSESLQSGDNVVYLSHLSAAFPYLNKLAAESSDLDAAIVSHLHPIKYQSEAVSCATCEGSGYINDQPCGSCNGTGRHSSSSPLTTYKVPPSESGAISPPAGYITPPIDAITAAREQINHHKTDAFDAINAIVLVEGVGVQQTARAKEIDREQLHALIADIASVVYDVIDWVLEKTTYIHVGALTADYPMVVRPTGYDTTQPVEALAQMKESAGLPHEALSAQYRSSMARVFGADSEDYARVKAQAAIDLLAFKTDDEILALKAAGAIKAEDVWLHAHVADILNSAPESFWSMSAKDQRAYAVAEATRLAPPPVIVTPIQPDDAPE